MSQIILSKYPDGGDHLVVGWDHLANGAFWQEWASREELTQAERWLSEHEDDYHQDVEAVNDNIQIADTGVKREGGMFPGIPLNKLRESMPEEFQPLVTDVVMALLHNHAVDPDSGYKGVIDLSGVE